jgi:hypothetical protein
MFFVICHPTVLQKLVPWKQICFYPVGHFIRQVCIFPIPIIIDPQLTFRFLSALDFSTLISLCRDLTVDSNNWHCSVSHSFTVAPLPVLALSSSSSDSSSDLSSRHVFPPLVRDSVCQLFAIVCRCRHFSLWWKLWSQWGK